MQKIHRAPMGYSLTSSLTYVKGLLIKPNDGGRDMERPPPHDWINIACYATLALTAFTLAAVVISAISS